MPDLSYYSIYLGIQNDPLGKTTEKYHVRQRPVYDFSRGTTSKLFFRVSDLAPVYESLVWDDLGDTSWTEHLNGGMVEYKGAFTDADFKIPNCHDPPAATDSAIYDTDFLQ